jgi:hypothetical protein
MFPNLLLFVFHVQELEDSHEYTYRALSGRLEVLTNNHSHKASLSLSLTLSLSL